MKTGIFFHYQEGERLRDFPAALKDLLRLPNIFLFDAFYPDKPKSDYDLEPVPEELLLAVHTREMVERVKQTPYYLTAVFSAGGTIQAAEKVCMGEIDNAFIFTGCGDHHAGRNFFGGWCYFNGAAMAIANLRRKSLASRFAIVDTDAHHGDGTWDIFREDGDVLYICLCHGPFREENGNINIPLPFHTDDPSYLEVFDREVLPRVLEFAPQVIFWNWGYDGTVGEYGNMGLSPEVHPELATRFKSLAEKTCAGRLVVVLCGGSSRRLATALIPRIIGVLAKSP